jgi:hypothetical protein
MPARKKTSKGEKPITKTAFIKSLPKDMPAKEVVAKAKAKGIELTDAYVYNIRGSAKRSKRGLKVKVTAASAKTAKKTATKRGPTNGASISKREFIESMPRETPAADVVAEAKKAGISVSANYVYMLRSTSKAKPGKAKPRAAASTKAATNGAMSPTVILSRLVVEHGVGTIRRLLAEVEQRVEELLAGR